MLPNPTKILVILGLCLVSWVGLWAYHTLAQSYRQAIISEKKQLARHFLLTDYCLTTESRHTRHVSLPEWIAPFQDLPAYHEHFPSSSFFQPIPIQQAKLPKR